MNIDALQHRLRELTDEAVQVFDAASDENELNQVKARFLGKKSEIAGMMRHMRDLSPEERPLLGAAVNQAKDAIENALEARKTSLGRAERDAELNDLSQDLTLPGRRTQAGAIHPLRRVEDDMIAVFRELGYDIAYGPQVETDFHNFEALNFPPDHPARDMQDTFLVEGDRVLRTHTSPVQIRTMLANEPPIRIAAPGAVFRSDSLDMTHSPCFHQVEGLVVDRGITMADLKGTLQAFVNRLFERDLRIRLRPSYFPFTEPSVEVDIGCVFCGGDGCRVCSHTGFIEILGAGMVDPEVFRSVGVDPEVYTGFAFGIGIERVAMLRYGIRDIRHFYENDVRFLELFV